MRPKPRVIEMAPVAGRQCGFTLIELMVAIFILLVLTSLAVPMARVTIKRQKERELKYDLRLMRDAIDRYKDGADRSYFQKADSYGYPKTLDVLVKGVEITGGKTVRFLREIPVDPMTGKAEWGIHSMEDDPDSDSWDESTVFDVYSKAEGTGLDGTRYRNW
jgi:general secretion pathway protein G